MTLKTSKLVLVGKTGAGKSTIANMLIQGDLFQKNRLDISNQAKGVTTNVEVVDGRDWTVVDTVGLGEMQGIGAKGTDEAIDLLIRVLKEGQLGFHHIAFVVQKGRLSTTENKQLFDLFKATFAGAEKNFVLIVTQCYDPRWIFEPKNRSVIAEVFGPEISVVCCDFPEDGRRPEQDREDRLTSLQLLEGQFLSLNRQPIVPKLSKPETATEETKTEFADKLGSFLGVSMTVILKIARIALKVFLGI